MIVYGYLSVFLVWVYSFLNEMYLMIEFVGFFVLGEDEDFEVLMKKL